MSASARARSAEKCLRRQPTASPSRTGYESTSGRCGSTDTQLRYRQSREAAVPARCTSARLSATTGSRPRTRRWTYSAPYPKGKVKRWHLHGGKMDCAVASATFSMDDNPACRVRTCLATVPIVDTRTHMTAFGQRNRSSTLGQWLCEVSQRQSART